MARPRKERRSEMMRVDEDFSSYARELSENSNKSITDTTKDIERQLRRLGKMKASIADMIVIPVFFFVIGIVIFAAYYTADKTNTIFTEIAGNGSASANATAKVVAAIGSMDSLYIFVMVAAFLAALIFAYFVNAHPVAFFFAVILLVIAVIINIYISNSFSQIAGTPLFATIADKYPYIVTINQNLPLIVAAFGTIMLVVLFAGKGIRGNIRP